MKIFCITQARMGSTRLPGKVLKTIEGKSLLRYHCERIKQALHIDQHIIATSVLPDDLAIVEFCKANNLAYFCGSESNVLERFYQSALSVNAKPDDLVIRVTGDCPLISPDLIDELVQHHLSKNASGISNINIHELPRGFDAEIFSMSALKDANSYADSHFQKEHVTPYLYQSNKYPVNSLSLNDFKKSITALSTFPLYRLCVDEAADFNLIKTLIEQYPNNVINAQAEEIIQFLIKHPDIAQINQSVQQKTH